MDRTLDHLVYATADLSTAVARFQQLTGVEPAAGGRHLGKGTRNYLVGLGTDRYLEIIGPDPEHPADPGVQVPFGVDAVETPRLLTWAVHPAQPEHAVASAAAAGAHLGELAAMSRLTAGGTELRWRLATAFPLPFDGLVPFVIDWGSSPHPAASGLPQLDLLSFDATHPDPAAVSSVLDTMQIRLPIGTGAPGLRAVLRGPTGLFELS